MPDASRFSRTDTLAVGKATAAANLPESEMRRADPGYSVERSHSMARTIRMDVRAIVTAWQSPFGKALASSLSGVASPDIYSRHHAGFDLAHIGELR